MLSSWYTAAKYAWLSSAMTITWHDYHLTRLNNGLVQGAMCHSALAAVTVCNPQWGVVAPRGLHCWSWEIRLRFKSPSLRESTRALHNILSLCICACAYGHGRLSRIIRPWLDWSLNLLRHVLIGRCGPSCCVGVMNWYTSLGSQEAQGPHAAQQIAQGEVELMRHLKEARLMRLLFIRPVE